MKFKIFASGSKGNCSLLQCNGLNILIDVGINYKTLENELDKIGLSPSDIDIILISHSHSDHIRGLSTLMHRTCKKIYTTEKLALDLIKYVDRQYIEIVDYRFIIYDVNIEFIPTSHDVTSYGFLIDYDNKSIVYITDTGYINKKYYTKLSNKSIYIIEANHDVEMLMEGPYPYYLKQRVVGDYGHLSNRAAGTYLSNCIGKDTKYILLAHISENNNTKQLAYDQIKMAIKETGFNENNIIVTDQYISSDVIEV